MSKYSTRGLMFLAGLFSAAAQAASPAAGTLTMVDGVPSDPLVYNSGPMPIPNASGLQTTQYACDDLNPCDHYELTIDLPEDFRSTHPSWRVEIKSTAIPAVADIDWQMSTPEGEVVHTVRDNPPAQPIYAFQPTGGLETFIVQIVPGTSVPDATATIRLYEDTAFSGEPAVVVAGGPNFVNYVAPGTASEPTMGINIDTNAAYYLDSLRVRKAVWDDQDNITWSDIGTGGAVTTADPFMTVDQFRFADGSANPRVWVAQLMAATSYIAFTDDDGANWTTSITGPGQVHGVDNQSITAGPYPAVKPVTAAAGTYEHAVYYCSHEMVNAFCSRSDDGGLTFGPSRPIFPLDAACNNHGHVKVGYDGTVFVPMNNTCQGTEGVSISIDAGETWHYIGVPGTQSGRWDSSIAMSNDGSTVWYGYAEEGDDRPMIVKGSIDKSNPDNPTIHWHLPATDVGVPAGLKNSVFPTVVAGDADRAAFAFHGTTSAGDSGEITSAMGFEWHLYIATTFDGGATWNLRNATPGDPIQRNDICDQGTNCATTGNHRNLLDFMDMDIDGEGRLILIMADGCTGGCVVPGGAANYSRTGVFVRQADGLRMYAAFDPLETDEPGTPTLSGSRDENGVTLNWAAVNSGNGGALTGYDVERADDGGDFVHLANTANNSYEDSTAVDAGVVYAYRIRANNSGGFSSAYSDVLSLALDPITESACELPGLTVATDAGGDHSAGTEAGDIEYVAVAEPYTDASDQSISFTMKVASLIELQPNTAWKIRFTVKDDAGVDQILYVEMSTKDPLYLVSGPSFGYGIRNGTTDTGQGGDLVSGSYDADGTITIKFDVSAPMSMTDLGGTSVLAVVTLTPGDLLGSITGATQLLIGAQPGGTGGGLLQTIDETPAGINYEILGNAACVPNDKPVAELLIADQYNQVPGSSVTVDFDATGSTDADGTIVEYRFSYGDGSAVESNSTGLSTHEFNGTAGQAFGVRVTVVDDLGGESAPSTMVQVLIPDEELEDDTDGDGILDSDEKPGCINDPDPACGDSNNEGNNGTLQAEMTVATDSDDPYTVTFDASGSRYAENADPINGALYQFVFGDGTQTPAQGSSVVSHSYEAAGDYTAYVVVSDANGNAAKSADTTVTITITINVTEPGTNAARLKVTNASGPAPLTVSFDATSSTTAEGYTITGYSWDFDGDGVVDLNGSNGQVQFVYTQAGTYTPTVTVSFGNGNETASSVAKAAVNAGTGGGGSTPVAAAAGGGSLGWLLLTPLLGAGLARRRKTLH